MFRHVREGILIKITQCHCIVPIFLQNCSTDFDETLCDAQACSEEGLEPTGMSSYPLFWRV